MSIKECDVVIYGGGHAGAMVAKQLADQHNVVLVDPNDFFEVTSSIVRNLVEPEFADNATFLLKDALPNVELIQGRLSELFANGEGKVVEVHDENADSVIIKARVVVLATGSRYPSPATRSTVKSSRKQRLDFHKKYAEHIAESQTIVIAGGGPIGVEFAAEIVDKYKGSKKVVLVNSGPRILGSTCERAAKVASDYLASQGVEILLNTKLEGTSKSPFDSGTAKLSNGKSIKYDMLLTATGGKPISDYMEQSWSASLNDRKEILVKPNFLVERSPKDSVAVFAMGDVAALDEPKLAWLVGSQIGVIVKNVRKTLAGTTADALDVYQSHPGDTRIGLTLGKDHGVLQIPYIGTVSWGWLVQKAKSRTMMVPKFRKEFNID